MTKKEASDYQQREIKFRVFWNNQVSTNSFTIGDFIEGVELYFKDGGCLPMTDIDWGQDQVAYIQRTGLKDKNGVDVYEGDIICFKGKNEYGLIVFFEGRFAYKLYMPGYPKLDEGQYLQERLTNGRLERPIVGNIFENPELLNQ